MLYLSKDRKTANKVTPRGEASIPNAFGLPAGHSCPGMTDSCASVCYASRIERYPSVSGIVQDNWQQLKDADEDTMYALLHGMILGFERRCERADAPMLFRIHWDGDFFSLPYILAWKRVVIAHPAVTFWGYTRNPMAIIHLNVMGLPNLTLYFSTDKDNAVTARWLRKRYGARLAYLAPTFADGQQAMRDLTGKPGGKCPENAGRIPLSSPDGSACFRCGLCITGKADIVFSSSKK